MLGSIFIFYLNFDSTFCKQTVQTQIRRRRTRRLILVYTVCTCPTKRMLGLYGLIELVSSIRYKMVYEYSKDWNQCTHRHGMFRGCVSRLRKRRTFSYPYSHHLRLWSDCPYVLIWLLLPQVVIVTKMAAKIKWHAWNKSETFDWEI